MLRDLTPTQSDLQQYMSDLSEEAYYAGWEDGLEFALWEVVLDQRTEYGRLVVTPEHRARLIALSDACGGWIVFDDVTEETWVSRADWEKLFSAWRNDDRSNRG